MTNQNKIPLYNALLEHTKKGPLSFHVPGHKYGSVLKPEANDFFQQILQIDATELSGLDDLHSPEGVIKEAEDLLASLYKTNHSFFLVNGSTVGNLAMILATCAENDIVLVQRNCHKSVLNALKLAKASPIFIEPEYDRQWRVATGVSLDTVEEAISLYPQAKAIILTYPNYFGMVYDLKALINRAHLHNIPVLVDEAHGPHFIIGDPFPPSAIELGADIVVQSAHKTLPAMTMGSYLHINSERIAIEKVKDYLQMLQSSSPSYPIMASLDLARNYLAAYDQDDTRSLINEINRFKNGLAGLTTIEVLEYPESQGDLLKVTIQSKCELSGFELQKRLEGTGIYTELADPFNVLFIFPLLKENKSYPLDEVIVKIKKALAGLPLQAAKEELKSSDRKISELAIPYDKMARLEGKPVWITEAVGSVCAETIIPYPPGIPLLLMGELITEDRIQDLKRLIEVGARFQGGSFLDKGLIKVFQTT
jgi:arginine/lysine/ornithine decarboxylase